jgi:uncharacterized protein (DUF2235 family)
MKRIVVCCDGTWDTPDQTTDGHRCPTNVYKLFSALARHDRRGVQQRRFYIRGVGTGRWDRIRGGAFGFGLSKTVRKAYKRISETYEPGDEIFLIGFSRGAFTARSTAGFIRNCGLLPRENLKDLNEAYAFYRDRSPDTKPSSPAAQDFRIKHSCSEPRIRCIAVWDTVGALGIPLSGLRWVNAFNRRWQFHDTDLSTTVEFAFQALAIDEKRRPFTPTLWHQQARARGRQHLEQVWFSGTHCDVGGGNRDSSLADVPLKWIVERLESQCGLAFKPTGFPSKPPAAILTRPNPLGPLTESWTGSWRILRPYVRPIGTADHERVASTAARRYDRDHGYSPENLIPHLDDPNGFLEIGGNRHNRGAATVRNSVPIRVNGNHGVRVPARQSAGKPPAGGPLSNGNGQSPQR